MPTTRRDRSGIFNPGFNPSPLRANARLDRIDHLSFKGVTFTTGQCLPEWTEVGVEMKIPGLNCNDDSHIGCRGVVVQCSRRNRDDRFEVSLLFLDLPKRYQHQLQSAASSARACSISIDR